MHRILALLLASAGLAACATSSGTSRAPGGSFYKQKVVPIEAAQSLVVEGPFMVSAYADAATPQVTLLGPPEMVEDTRIIVEDGALVIRFADGASWNWNTGAGMHVSVDLPALHSVAVEGPGKLDVRNVKADSFEAGNSGSGTIKLIGVEADTFQAGTGGSGSIHITRLDAKTVALGTGGSGSIYAHGTANTASIGTGGSGSIDAKRLRVATADLGVGGSGSIYADVSESAQIGVAGSGRVDVVGGAECTFPASQARKIECR